MAAAWQTRSMRRSRGDTVDAGQSTVDNRKPGRRTGPLITVHCLIVYCLLTTDWRVRAGARPQPIRVEHRIVELGEVLARSLVEIDDDVIEKGQLIDELILRLEELAADLNQVVEGVI